MNHSMTVHNFGPIKDAYINVRSLLALIGPQSSGKSTIAKLVYFFLHVRDEVTAFVLDRAQSSERGKPDWALKKRLRNRFVEFWGPTPQPRDVRIEYNYGKDLSLTVTLDRQHHKYITPVFSQEAWKRIRDILRETEGQIRSQRRKGAVMSAVGKLVSEQQRTAVLERIRERCNGIFCYDKELFFIPAGRSLLSTLADQIQYIHPHLLDYPMRQFVETVNSSKVYFDRPLDELIRDKQALSTADVWFSAVRRCQSFTKRILKGEYVHDREGGKLYISDDVFTKISYASSGQQEAVWILLSLFLLVLEKTQSLVVIEEPEAHLFPDAQKELLEYVSFVLNRMGCDFVITTHSPYMISCLNNLLYAHDVAGRRGPAQVEEVIARNLWIDPQQLAGYYVRAGGVEDLAAPDVAIMRTELLDSASELINEEYERLLRLEGTENKQ